MKRNVPKGRNYMESGENIRDGLAAEPLWEKRFFDIVSMAKSWSWFDEREDFYASIAYSLKEATGADSANIRLLTPMKESFIVYALDDGVQADASKRYDILPVDMGRMPRLVETGEPIVLDFKNPSNDDAYWLRGAEEDFSCAVIVALSGTQGIVGAADLLFRNARSWSDSDLEWIKGLGEFVGVSIGNILLSDNMLGLRIAEERRILSNEIHDNVAQSMSVILLEAESAVDSLARRDMDALRRNIDLIGRASAELETAIRGEMTNLKSSVEPGGDSTVAQIEATVEGFCRQSGMDCETVGDDRSRTAVVPKRVMVQLTRVVNEAMVNIIHHAHATKVVFAYEVTDAGLSMTIADDGCGFDVARVPSSHFGLRIMRERLEGIGGSLDIASVAGEGTRVSIIVPRLL